MIRNERGGADTLLITMFVVPLLLFASFAGVPFFVYILKANHLNVVANHALKEAEAVGYVSPAIASAAAARLSGLGMEPITIGGVSYPSFEGSTVSKVYKDSANSTVTLVVKYPAPGLSRMLRAVGGSGGTESNEGFYRIVLHGKSEAYE
ncbi:hypothetical protein [Paenibacillus thermotolerans]|uniref:hypothetical protein n=1 Tax=Paenibacillus thermotolerans TaxID=3027807 RepID=UPI002367DC3A|nr:MULTISPECIES: hypothetical protein [unclassified Paenibacillus]